MVQNLASHSLVKPGEGRLTVVVEHIGEAKDLPIEDNAYQVRHSKEPH